MISFWAKRFSFKCFANEKKTKILLGNIQSIKNNQFQYSLNSRTFPCFLIKLDIFIRTKWVHILCD